MSSMLEECPHCHWKYPWNLLSEFVTNACPLMTICGICALELSNIAIGIQRTKFDGVIAEHMRLLAIQWRKTHPEQKL